MRSKRDKKKSAAVESSKDGESRGSEKIPADLLQETAAKQAEIAQCVSDLAGQNAYLRAQMGQIYEAVRQLYDAVGGQCRQLLDSDQSLRQELQRFQTGGPQRAMAGVFHKLFRDLIGHAGELDEMFHALQASARTEADEAWLESLRVLRSRYESMLMDWGCASIPVEVGQLFDPEIQEAVPAAEGEIPESSAEHVIVKIRRRGWSLHGEVLAPPQVVVS